MFGPGKLALVPVSDQPGRKRGLSPSSYSFPSPLPRATKVSPSAQLIFYTDVKT